jgi:type I restriction enzyme, S subunit
MADVSTTSVTIARSDLPVLPADWRWVQFSETCDRVSVGHVGPTSEFFTDAPDGICFLRSQNVRPGKLESENALSITPDFHRKLKKSQLQTGDILFVRVGANRGDCCVVPSGVGELNCANIVFARPKQPTGFHAYFFQSDLGRNLLLSASVGAAQGVINTGSVASMPVPLPSLPIQRRIAGILSAYDGLIENSQRRIKVLELIARALYREWFVHFRFPGHDSVARVPSPLGDIPKGWEVKKLKDVCRLTMGQSPKSEFYNEAGDGVAFHQGVTDFGDRFPTDRLFCTAEGRIAEVGDILFSVRAPVGRMNIADKKIVLGRGLSAIRHSHGYQAFLWEQLRSRFTKDDMMGNGAIFASVTKDDMQGIDLVCPPASVTKTATAHFESLHSELATLSRQVQNLRRTRDLLLPRLLSGQIDVKAMPA